MCVLESSESQCFGFEWFNVNFMKAISGKRHLTMSSKNQVIADDLIIESNKT